MEQDECRKLLPLVNPKLYKSTLNKERLKLREEEKAEKELLDSALQVKLESPEDKAEPVLNEKEDPIVDSKILLDVTVQLTDIKPMSEEPNQISITGLNDFLEKECATTPDKVAPTQ